MLHVPLNLRTLPLIAALGGVALGGIGYLNGRDVALAEARTHITAAPEIVKIVGGSASTTVLKSVYYQGVPGGDPAYRQYTMLVSGQAGSVTVLVRAQWDESERSWKVNIHSVN